MNRMRIGELLGQMGKLSGHDIDEILQEQSATGHRFGDIALTWGLVQPEHIWTAWCSQLQGKTDPVDLEASKHGGLKRQTRADQCKRPSRHFRNSKDHSGPGSHDPAGSGRFYAPSAAGDLTTGLVSGHSHRQNLHRMHDPDMLVFQVAVNLHPASRASCRNYVRARLRDGLNLVSCDP